MESAADEELVQRYLDRAETPAGRAALDELFGRYHRRVALWCLRIAGDRETALDLTQEVFLRAYRGLDSFRGGSKFSTWLYAIARNHCFNAAKSQARRPADPAEPEVFDRIESTELDPHQQAEAAQLFATAQALMDGELNAVERQAMLLHYRDELPLDSVTRLLKLSNASGAKAAIVSAKRKLKRAWDRRQAAATNVPKAGG